jgi:hypothetical protein
LIVMGLMLIDKEAAQKGSFFIAALLVGTPV